MAQTRNATLVVIEYGGAWPRWLHPSGSGDIAVVAQHYPGAPSSLVAQVASRVTRVEMQGWQLARMVMVSNGKTDKDSTAARSVLARGLMARVREVPHAELVLTCSDATSLRASRELLALAQAFESVAERTGVTLAVRTWDGALQYASKARPVNEPEALARAS